MRRSQKSTPTGVILSHAPSSKTNDKATRTGSHLQVFRLRFKKLELCVLVILILCVNLCVAYPRPKISKVDTTAIGSGAVYFKIPMCRTVPEEVLQKRLGPVMDGSKMAESLGHQLDDEFDDSEDMQGDDADAYSEDMFDEDEDEDYDDEDEYGSDEGYDKSDAYRYMRKRRSVSDGDKVRHESQVSKRGASFKSLHLRLIDSKNNNLTKKENAMYRKQLKKNVKRKLRRKIPPWTCKVKFGIRKMEEGTFPFRITEGNCLAKKCFYKIYNCEPKKYRIKVLQRDPNACYPVPHIGVNTTYEEKWEFKTIPVTVGCNCERRRQKKPRRH